MTEDADQIFFEARKHEDPVARTAYLDLACRNSPQLRARVAAMLADEAAAESWFGDTHLGREPEGDAPAGSTGAGGTIEQSGQFIGRYKLLRKLGEGGFGSVWMAEQTEPVTRPVAIKIIKQGMDTREVIARFEGERQAVALMDHPNIAKVLDADATETGRPFFVMELVEGVPVTQFCNDRKLNTRQRLALFADICSAVNHAHQKGIIHRDLKPSNVLVTLDGDQPIPKVIDFGIAKAIEGKLSDRTIITRLDQFIGTPAYMSPEQTERSAADIDTRSDVYSLGILLYELLIGIPPFDTKSLLSAGYDEMRRIIREQDPLKPSSRISSLEGPERELLGNRHTIELARLQRLVHGELDWIVMKAIEKDRSRRYTTASALAQDIGRYLAGAPVEAAAPSLRYKFGKFARRNRGKLAAVATVAATLVAGTVVSTLQAFRAIDQAARANRAEALAEDRLAIAEEARDTAEALAKLNREQLILSHTGRAGEHMQAGDPSLALPWLVRSLALNGGDDDGQELQRVRIAKAFEQAPRLLRFWSKPGHASLVTFSPDGAYALSAASRESRQDWSSGGMELWHVATGETVDLEEPKGQILHATFSPQGSRLATISRSGVIRIWNPATGGILTRFEVVIEKENHAEENHAEGNHLVFSPDGARLLSYGRRGLARLWDAHSGRLLIPKLSLNDETHLIGGAFSPDGKRISLLNHSGIVFTFAAETGQAALPELGEPGFGYGEPGGLRYASNGDVLAFPGGDKSTLRILDAKSGLERASLRHSRPIASFDTSPDGNLIATATLGIPAAVRVWNLHSGTPVTPPILTPSPLSMVRFSPDSRLIVTGSFALRAQVWDALSGAPVSPPMWHTAALQGVAFHPSQRAVITGCADGTVRVWSIVPSAPANTVPVDGHLEHVAADRAGGQLLTSTSDGEMRLHQTADGKTFSAPALLKIPQLTPPCIPEKRLLPFLDHEPVVQFWNLDAAPFKGPAVDWAPPGTGLPRVALTPDHTRVAVLYTSLSQSAFQLWDLVNSRALTSVRGVAVRLFKMSPDGKTLAILYGGEMSLPHQLHLYSTKTGQTIGDPIEIESFTADGAFSPDGQFFHLATKALPYAETGSDGILHSWKVESGESVFRKPIQAPGLLTHHPDGNAIAVSHGNQLRIYDSRSAEPTTPFLPHQESIEAARFSPDGRYLASTDLSNRLYLHHARTGIAVVPPIVHPGKILQTWFTPDSRRIGTSCTDGHVRFHDLSPDSRTVADLHVHAELLSANRVDDTGSLSPLTREDYARHWAAWLELQPSGLAPIPAPADQPSITPDDNPVPPAPWNERALQEWNGKPGQILTVPGNFANDGLTGFILAEGAHYRLFPCPVDTWNTSSARRRDVDYRGHVRDVYVTSTGRPYMQLCYAVGESEYKAVTDGERVSGVGELRLLPSDPIGTESNRHLANNSGFIRVKVARLPE